MQKNTTKVPAYTRNAIAKYKKKFSQLHVSLTPQAYAIFNQKYPQYSFNQYVNETIEMLLKKDSDVCGFGPGDIQSCDIIKKEACIPHEVKDQIMEKFSTSIEKAGHKRWVSHTGIVSWAVNTRLLTEVPQDRKFTFEP